MSPPLVSIVTPSYNQAQFLEETILSVKGQDYPNLEHIVVDGGSTDGTVEVLSRYENEYNLRWTSEPDEGQSDAINKGFRRARGEIIGWLNSDDTYLPQAIHKAGACFEAHPGIDWVYGDGYLIDAQSRVLRMWKARPFSLKALLYVGQFICQPAVFFRRRALEVVGPLDSALHFTMDYDFFIRLGRQCKSVYLPELLATRRLTLDAKSLAQAECFCTDWLATLDKAFGTPGLPSDVIAAKNQAYANVHYQGGKRYFEQRRLTEARKYLWRAWQLDRRLFRRQSAVVFVLLFQSLLDVRWLMPRSFRQTLRAAENQDNTARVSVAWPVGVGGDE